MTIPKLYVVVLAAGLSRRLGIAKQLILQDNQTLVARAIKLALLLSPNQVYVVLPNLSNDWSTKLYKHVCQLPVEIIDNDTPETGMAHSIRLAVSVMRDAKVDSDSRVLFLTVDQLALTLSDLQRLTMVTSQAVLTVSRYGQDALITGIPVNLPFGFLDEFANQLHGDKGFRSLWQSRTTIASSRQAMTYQIQPIDLPHLAQDIDTLAQFERLKAAYHLSLPTLD